MKTGPQFLLWVSIFAAGFASTGAKYFGKKIGEFEETSHGVKGVVYAADHHTLVIQNFSYDGSENDVYFWGDMDVIPTGNGIILPVGESVPGEGPIEEYDDENVIISLPSKIVISHISSIAVWDIVNQASFGHVTIPEDFDPPEEMTLGPFSSPVKSGPVVIKDDRTLLVTKMQLNCPSGDIEFLVGNSSVPDPDGALALIIDHSVERKSRMMEKLMGQQESITLTFPDNLKASDFNWVGVRCSVRSTEEFSGHVFFPKTSLNVPPSLEKIMEREEREFRDEGVYSGVQVGSFEDTLHGVKGDVYLASEDSFIIRGFSYDGKAPDAHFWAGSTDKPSPKGFIVPNELGSEDNLPDYHDKDIHIKLPKGNTTKDIKWLAVWCKSFNAVFGFVGISPDTEAPKNVTIGPLPTFNHGVRSDPVVIVDEHTIVIPNMFYDGYAPDVYFLLGKGRKIHHERAVKLSRNGSFERIKDEIFGLDVTLKLPEGQTVRDFDWLSVYCIRFSVNFGHVFIPKRVLVPPVLEKPQHVKAPKVEELGQNYYGKRLGDFQNAIHQVKGTVYAASPDTLFIKGFSYDGLGQDTYFWVGVEGFIPSSSGFPILDEQGRRTELKAYANQDILVTLPKGGRLEDLKYFSVWSKRIDGSFGHVIFPIPLNAPSEQSLGRLPSYAHGVSSGDVKILDTKTIFIEDLHYDGLAPDAFFLVGKGPYPLPNGTKVPDESGSLSKIHVYKGENVTLRLPGDMTVLDIDWLSLYCITYTENFGHVFIPKDLNIPADLNSLVQQKTDWTNCEVIFPDVLEVSWNLEPEHLYIQMEGKIKSNEYMSFGISRNQSISRMVGSDVALVFQRTTSWRATVVDYHLSAKAQCSDGVGACPDVKVGGTEDLLMTSSQRKGDILTVSFRKPLKTADERDLNVSTSESVAVVAAIGHIDSRQEAGFHHSHYVKETLKIHFGRNPTTHSECKVLDRRLKKEVLQQIRARVDEQEGPWERGLVPEGVHIFNAQLGPTGGEKGYDAITGHHSWGYAWWINGELIPELKVTRGQTYTFHVEGGPRHPLYITDNPQGGGSQYPDELENEGHRVFAGIAKNASGHVFPIGVGRLCEWKHEDLKDISYESYKSFKRAIKLVCQEGQPGTFTWTPDQDTPDIVYYQCFIHRNFGWKIHVTNPAT